MNWFERLITTFSPSWGASRQVSRTAIVAAERLGSFTEALPTRLDKPVTSRGTAADWALELGFDRRRLVDRARQVERDNILACALLDRSQEAVVGSGFRLRALSDDPDWNKTLEQLWVDWGRDEADVRRLMTFDQIMAYVFRSKIRDGDVAAIKLKDGSLRIVESDEIASPEGGYVRPRMVDGVELDGNGRPVTFHVFASDFNPGVVWADRRLAPARIEVPASNVIFLARRQRAGQTRGLTAFNGLFWILEQLEGSIEATTIAARMAACMGLVIRRNSPQTGMTLAPDATGTNRRQMNIEPGMVQFLYPGEDITQIDPKNPATGMEGHLRLLMRLCGTAFGLPLEIVLGDFSQSNYSNARAAMIQTQRTWRILQNEMSHFASQVFRWKVMGWIEAGVLPARADAFRHKFITPGWSWIDPTAEVQANQAAIDSCFMTHSEIANQNGHDFEDLLETQKRDRELMAQAGVSAVRSPLTRDEIPTTRTISEDKTKKGASVKNRAASPF